MRHGAQLRAAGHSVAVLLLITYLVAPSLAYNPKNLAAIQTPRKDTPAKDIVIEEEKKELFGYGGDDNKKPLEVAVKEDGGGGYGGGPKEETKILKDEGKQDFDDYDEEIEESKGKEVSKPTFGGYGGGGKGPEPDLKKDDAGGAYGGDFKEPKGKPYGPKGYGGAKEDDFEEPKEVGYGKEKGYGGEKEIIPEKPKDVGYGKEKGYGDEKIIPEGPKNIGYGGGKQIIPEGPKDIGYGKEKGLGGPKEIGGYGQPKLDKDESDDIEEQKEGPKGDYGSPKGGYGGPKGGEFGPAIGGPKGGYGAPKGGEFGPGIGGPKGGYGAPKGGEFGPELSGPKGGYGAPKGGEFGPGIGGPKGGYGSPKGGEYGPGPMGPKGGYGGGPKRGEFGGNGYGEKKEVEAIDGYGSDYNKQSYGGDVQKGYGGPTEEQIKGEIGYNDKPSPQLTTGRCNKIVDGLLGNFQSPFVSHMNAFKIPRLSPIRLGHWANIKLYDGKLNHFGRIERCSDFHIANKDDYLEMKGMIRVPEPKAKFCADASLYNRLKIRNRNLFLGAKEARFMVDLKVDKRHGRVEVDELEPKSLTGFQLADGHNKDGSLVWPFTRINDRAIQQQKLQFMGTLQQELCNEFRNMVHRPEIQKSIIDQV